MRSRTRAGVGFGGGGVSVFGADRDRLGSGRRHDGGLRRGLQRANLLRRFLLGRTPLLGDLRLGGGLELLRFGRIGDERKDRVRFHDDAGKVLRGAGLAGDREARAGLRDAAVLIFLLRERRVRLFEGRAGGDGFGRLPQQLEKGRSRFRRAALGQRPGSVLEKPLPRERVPLGRRVGGLARDRAAPLEERADDDERQQDGAADDEEHEAPAHLALEDLGHPLRERLPARAEAHGTGRGRSGARRNRRDRARDVAARVDAPGRRRAGPRATGQAAPPCLPRDVAAGSAR